MNFFTFITSTINKPHPPLTNKPITTTPSSKNQPINIFLPQTPHRECLNSLILIACQVVGRLSLVAAGIRLGQLVGIGEEVTCSSIIIVGDYMKEQELPLLSKSNNAVPVSGQHTEQHVEVGEYVKSFVYGGLDGTINILVVVITGVFSSMSNSNLVAMAVAISIGDAIGMGLGDYLSYKSEQKFVLTERQREQYEFQHMRKEEIAEMQTLLQEFAYSSEQAKRLTGLYATHKDTFINIMMMMQLGLVVNHVEAWKVGCINFSSFLTVSLLPLLPFILFPSSPAGIKLPIALLVGGVQLFSLGYIKGEIIKASGEKKRRSGIQMVVFGVVVVLIGYIVGNIFESQSH